MESNESNRRQMLRDCSALGMASVAGTMFDWSSALGQVADQDLAVPANMIGAYGPWAASIVGDAPAELSFRRAEFRDVEAWRVRARARTLECLQQPTARLVPEARVEASETHEGVDIEHLSWQLPFGPLTKALMLKPAGAKGALPGILGLHDHGGMKYFGFPKITRTNAAQHPLIVEHQRQDYGGLAWANEIARRGYAVLVHDTFTFGSRRVDPQDLPERLTRNLPPMDDESSESVRVYNAFAADHEHLMAKSLFCAGTTWPGVFTWEDQRALDYLCSRDDVDAERVGCAGLSGGGLRTVYLAGIDERIRCACCVGMMSTWRDYLLHKAYTHTWMIYIPLLPNQLDYPEILAMRAPLPTMVLNNTDDPLFTLPEMQRADGMMSEIFAKAEAADRYRCRFYPGPHKFDREMQAEAWSWFDRWLKS
ncbi:MAG: prolyl oligopeptidase family serine peptidase [bacterium]|nr:prolyl oligopeptidase family serine peptidase [bacterium]